MVASFLVKTVTLRVNFTIICNDDRLSNVLDQYMPKVDRLLKKVDR